LGSLKGKDLVPISEVANKPYRIDMRSKKVSDGAGGLIEHPIKFPIWFDPTTKSGTPMCGALEYACGITENWLKDHPKCFPPLVINITDGESTDGDPSAIAAILRALYSEDGEVLLFNLHLSSQNKKPITFPDSESQLPDQLRSFYFKCLVILQSQCLL
jgi:hypothetical protein